MRVNITIDWNRAPGAGRFGTVNATVANGLICQGWGRYEPNTRQFTFTSVTEPCRMCFAIDVLDGASAVAEMDMTPQPFQFDVNSVLQKPEGTLRLDEIGVTIEAETDYWATL